LVSPTLYPLGGPRRAASAVAIFARLHETSSSSISGKSAAGVREM